MDFTRCYSCMQELDKPGGRCPRCGNDNTTHARSQPSHALPCGYLLHGKYVIGRTLGQGGFGVTYIGWDLALETRVCIKEYFPAGAAMRSSTMSTSVTWSGGNNAEELKGGRDSFIKEARKAVKLRKLNAVVQVWDVFYENETAYLVMDYVEGVTLKRHLTETRKPLSEEECVRLLMPVMKDLEAVHARGIIHRDISPDNLMLQTDGTLVLLDIGAAKDLSRGNGQSSMLVAKKGFSPLEQYTTGGNIGSWTDVYAMCATIVYCVTGKLIPTPMDRVSGVELDLSGLTPAFAEVLKKGLAIRPEERIQSMGELANYFIMAIKPTAMPEPVSEPSSKPVSEPIPESLPELKPALHSDPITAPKQKTKGKKGKLGKGFLAAILLVLLAALAVGVFVREPKDSSGVEMPLPQTNQPDTIIEQGSAVERTSTLTRIGLVTDVGGINDMGGNQTIWEALKTLVSSDSGFEVRYLESRVDPDYQVNINAFVDEGCDLIITVGYMMADATRAAAEANPNQKFAIVDDASCADLSNVACLMFAPEQASYLVGLVAGYVTQSKTVGYVQGMVSDEGNLYGIGYITGVREACPNATILEYNANSFADIQGGYSVAKDMITKGADVIFQAAGGTGFGVINACGEEGVWAIGVDVDQSLIAPTTVLTSAVKRVDVAAQDISKAVQSGAFSGGVRLYDLSNGGVDLAPSREHIPNDVLALIEEAKDRVVSGEKTIPITAAECPDFYLG